jgi:actin-related protein
VVVGLKLYDWLFGQGTDQVRLRLQGSTNFEHHGPSSPSPAVLHFTFSFVFIVCSMASSSGVSATPQKKIAFSRTRPGAALSNLTGSPAVPSSPQTPLGRSVSSLYGSPGGSFRVEEENLLVFEIGSRVIRAGFSGESSPRCQISYHPDQLRRVGDYRQYTPEYRRRKRKLGENWADMYELWHPDVRDQDLSLLGDRLERIIRDIESTHLLLDATRTRKVALVASSQLPRPLLEMSLSSLFGALQCINVTLFPSNTMAVAAAGLRSGLVIDLGWAETSVSAIFEYREVSQKTSTRGSKMMVEAYAKMILEETGHELTLDEAEDVMVRLGWCREHNIASDTTPSEKQSLYFPDFTADVGFEALADPSDTVLFDKSPSDDHDQSLPNIAYDVLLHLPIDVRFTCLSRIIITGGASGLPGLKRRFLQELKHLLKERDWNPVRNYGSAKDQKPVHDVVLTQESGQASADTTTKTSEDQIDRSDYGMLPAHAMPQEPDPILSKISKQRQAKGEDHDHDLSAGTVRIVNSLGAWNGVSIVSNLRVRGTVEIDRDRFLSGGLIAGATASKRDTINLAVQRQSLAGPPANIRQVSLDRTHSTLGVWT